MDIFNSLTEKYHICSVYCNRDYEPYTITDMHVEVTEDEPTEFITYKDHVIFEKDELVKRMESPIPFLQPIKTGS